MAFSVNTNVGAFVALQSLSQTNRDLTVVQNRINTGQAVSGAKDNSAVFQIAQNLRSDLGGLNAVKQSLSNASSTLDIGIAAAETISDLVVELKEKAVAAADTGIDAASRAALANDYAAIVSQIGTVVANAEFNGTNLIKATPDSVSAITNDTGTQTISVAGSSLVVGGSNLTFAATITSAGDASTAVTAIETSLGNINTVLSTLGSGARQIETQANFVNKLSDTIETGIGNLVDADLARESARLQALQVRQQLGLQALSIANQAPAAVLALFR